MKNYPLYKVDYYDRFCDLVDDQGNAMEMRRLFTGIRENRRKRVSPTEK